MNGQPGGQLVTGTSTTLELSMKTPLSPRLGLLMLLISNSCAFQPMSADILKAAIKGYLVTHGGDWPRPIGQLIKPEVEVHRGFPPEKVKLNSYIGNRKVVLLGLPGAFTPT